MTRFIGPATLLLLSTSLLATTIQTSTSCSATQLLVSTSQTGVTNCSASALNPPITIPEHSSASVAGTWSLNAAQTIYSTQFQANVLAEGQIGSASAIVNGQDIALFTTTGPVRPGVLTVTLNVLGSGISADHTFALNIGSSYIQSCTQSVPSATAICTVPPTIGVGTASVPFTLGQPFSFDENFQLRASQGGGGIPHFEMLGLNVAFSVFEGNGTTAVGLQIVPEPQSFALISSGLLLVGLIGRRALKIQL